MELNVEVRNAQLQAAALREEARLGANVRLALKAGTSRYHIVYQCWFLEPSTTSRPNSRTRRAPPRTSSA